MSTEASVFVVSDPVGRKCCVSASVLVKLLPRHRKVRMSVPAATHLFRLLQAYNWVTEAGDKGYSTRWAIFWPLLEPIERKALVLLLMTNGVKSVGTPLHAIEIPVELEEAGDRPMWGGSLPMAIAAELRSVVALHHARLVNKATVIEWWREHCEEAFEWLVGACVVDEVLDPAYGFHSDLVYEAAVAAAVERGVGEVSAREHLQCLASELDELLLHKEELFWNGLSGA